MPISEMATQDVYSTISIHFSFHGRHYDPTLNVLYSDGVFHYVIWWHELTTYPATPYTHKLSWTSTKNWFSWEKRTFLHSSTSHVCFFLIFHTSFDLLSENAFRRGKLLFDWPIEKLRDNTRIDLITIEIKRFHWVVTSLIKISFGQSDKKNIITCAGWALPAALFLSSRDCSVCFFKLFNKCSQLMVYWHEVAGSLFL